MCTQLCSKISGHLRKYILDEEPAEELVAAFEALIAEMAEERE
jgi:hypothetical protein